MSPRYQTHVLILRAAGAFWCLYGAYLLAYSWFRPASIAIVDFGPPTFCIGYGAILFQVHHSAVPIGWVLSLLLIGGGAVTGLIQWPPYVGFVVLQLLLAAYTTSIRGRMSNTTAG